jgi:hypothetical protein
MSKNREIKLTKFNMASVGDRKVCVFVGKRNSGKSFCVKDMLYYQKNIPVVRVISGTERANKHYSHFVPPVFINFEFTDDIINNFMKRQHTLMAKSQEQRYKNMDKRAILILDDLMFAKNSWVKNPRIKEIAMNGRHWDVSFIITLQYCLGIPPDLRANVDYVFLFKENRASERRKLYEYWAGVIPTYSMFCEIMDACTNDYGCIVIDTVAKSNKLEDQVFYYKAETHEDFKMCGSKAWSFSESHNHSSDGFEKSEKKNYSITLE